MQVAGRDLPDFNSRLVARQQFGAAVDDERLHRAALKRQVVVLSVAKPAPKVASSAAFAERRIADGKRTPELASRAAPIEGLGAPAIRSDDGSGPATIEAVTAGRIVSVTAPTVEAATALAKKAIPRVR